MIRVKNLRFAYRTTPLFDSFDYTFKTGSVHAIIGRSGCGKTTLASAMLRLIEPSSGKIIINNRDIMALNKTRLKKLRPQYQIIWQNPEASLNPRMKIKDNILEPGRYFGKINRKNESEFLSKYLSMVELPMDLINRYPHEVSGGENQRAVIARMLTMTPELLIADEPTSALDILVQQQILTLIKKIQKQMKMTIIFISHDLRVINYMCRDMAVMQNGKIVESGPCDTLLSNPMNDYTRTLVANTFGPWR